MAQNNIILNKTNLDSIFVFSLWHKTRKTGNISFCDRTTSVITDELKNENYDEISDFTSATLCNLQYFAPLRGNFCFPIPGIIFLRCLASWLAGLFRTKIPLHVIMTPKASMSSSRYPTYSIVSPFTAVNLNQSPVGKTGLLFTYPYLSHCCSLLSLGSLWQREVVWWLVRVWFTLWWASPVSLVVLRPAVPSNVSILVAF